MSGPAAARARRRAVRRGTGNPALVVVAGFTGAAAVGTALLSLPAATASGQRAPLVDALFTAVSAVCVTGLVTVDTGTYWSGPGQAVILLLIQAGGLGIMTLATLLALLLRHRLGLRARLVAQAETKTLTGADVRRVVRRVVLFSLGCEAVVAVVLTARFLTTYDASLGGGLYEGVFHAVSAFNNAGFSTHADSLVGYAGDPVVLGTLCAAVVVGGLGFPVVFELVRSWRRPSTWSVLTRVTVLVTAVLLVVGTVGVLVPEAGNPATLGGLDVEDRLLGAVTASVMARTAGFNAVDIGALHPETLFLHDVLMFIGGGSAGTAGGIKVTTFGILAFVVWAEVRGEPDAVVGRRRVPRETQRQALTVALLGVGLCTLGTSLLLDMTAEPLDAVLFEAVSAFGTVGLSTGITADLPTDARLVLVGLMLAGRVGPLTAATALALRERTRRTQLPEERTIVG
ncbi:potassium transporter TrkG [Pseudokineococcus basanitobsidens]|uniref:Potassium transporter TrkG n=1 Tax=Pseudokineococcus basanitobsidens TaxID=1926649 RepID=A0ABU8RLU0_9ACTN